MKNKILKTITGIMAVLFLWAAAGYDSGSTAPHIVLSGSLIWGALFLIANRGAINGR